MSALDTLRTDVVGSLLRPADWREARTRFERGEIDAGAFAAIERECVRRAIALQEAAGLGVVTDGELSRLNFQDSFGMAVSGYDAAPDRLRGYERRTDGAVPLKRWDMPDVAERGTPVSHRRPVVSRLALVRNVPLEEYERARPLAKRPLKVSLIGPDRVLQRFDHAGSKHVYASVDDFAADVVAVERRMIGGLVDAGCRYVHIDAPGLTAYVDEPSRAARTRRRTSRAGSPPRPPSCAASRASPSACTCAAATSEACGTARARTTRSPSRCSARCRTSASSSSTTRRGPEASRPCASCPRTASSCSGWSAPRCRSSRRWTSCAGASTRR